MKRFESRLGTTPDDICIQFGSLALYLFEGYKTCFKKLLLIAVCMFICKCGHDQFIVA